MHVRVVSSALSLLLSAGAIAQNESNWADHPNFNCFPPAAVPTRPNIVCREPGLTGRPPGWNEPRIGRIISELASVTSTTPSAAADLVAARLFTKLQTEWEAAPHYSLDAVGIDLQNFCGGIDVDAVTGYQIAPRDYYVLGHTPPLPEPPEWPNGKEISRYLHPWNDSSYAAAFMDHILDGLANRMQSYNTAHPSAPMGIPRRWSFDIEIPIADEYTNDPMGQMRQAAADARWSTTFVPGFGNRTMEDLYQSHRQLWDNYTSSPFPRLLFASSFAVAVGEPGSLRDDKHARYWMWFKWVVNQAMTASIREATGDRIRAHWYFGTANGINAVVSRDYTDATDGTYEDDGFGYYKAWPNTERTGAPIWTRGQGRVSQDHTEHGNPASTLHGDCGNRFTNGVWRQGPVRGYITGSNTVGELSQTLGYSGPFLLLGQWRYHDTNQPDPYVPNSSTGNTDQRRRATVRVQRRYLESIINTWPGQQQSKIAAWLEFDSENVSTEDLIAQFQLMRQKRVPEFVAYDFRNQSTYSPSADGWNSLREAYHGVYDPMLNDCQVVVGADLTPGGANVNALEDTLRAGSSPPGNGPHGEREVHIDSDGATLTKMDVTVTNLNLSPTYPLEHALPGAQLWFEGRIIRDSTEPFSLVGQVQVAMQAPVGTEGWEPTEWFTLQFPDGPGGVLQSSYVFNTANTTVFPNTDYSFRRRVTLDGQSLQYIFAGSSGCGNGVMKLRFTHVNFGTDPWVSVYDLVQVSRTPSPDALVSPISTQSSTADYDHNGVVDLDDLTLFLDDWSNSRPGADVAIDGVVNADDFALFIIRYNEAITSN